MPEVIASLATANTRLARFSIVLLSKKFTDHRLPVCKLSDPLQDDRFPHHLNLDQVTKIKLDRPCFIKFAPDENLNVRFHNTINSC